MIAVPLLTLRVTLSRVTMKKHWAYHDVVNITYTATHEITPRMNAEKVGTGSLQQELVT